MKTENLFERLIVVKRSGQRVTFNDYKIAIAIKKAFDTVYLNNVENKINKVYKEVLEKIEIDYEERKTINVENIQDLIEEKLKKTDPKVHLAFNNYRNKRAASRKIFESKKQHKLIKAIEKIVDNENCLIENTLKTKDILNNCGKTIINEYIKVYLMDNRTLKAHEEGTIHLHNLSSYALGQLSKTHLIYNHYLNNDYSNNFLIKARQEISDEINIPSIDNLFETYFLKTFKKYYQEYLNDYLNIFGLINYLDIKKINETIEKENIFLNKSIFKQYIYSDQVQRLFEEAYKKSLFKTKKNTSNKIKNLLKTLNYDLKTSISFGLNTSKVGDIINNIILKTLKENNFNNLNIIFKLNINNLESIYNYLKLKEEIKLNFNNNEYFSDGAKIFEENIQSVGRMVIATTSINMSRLGLKNQNQLKSFWLDLDKVLELVKNNLLNSFETLGNKTKENYNFLFNKNILEDDKLELGQKIRKVIKNGVLMIGLIGLKECVSFLEKDEAKQYQLTKQILNYLNKQANVFTEETKINFAVFEPLDIEARKKLNSLDRAIYGKIIPKEKYDLISNLKIIKKDYKKIAEIQNLWTGGNFVQININKNISLTNFEKLIKKIVIAQINFCSISMKGGSSSEY